ncbi:MAG: di-trans,poly-cis-decaprenylcistransferase [Planctomycetes bacterium]|nr:di-trans,poly-cis-decaprenylcistransferase [Planctomycetota bacterium]
MTAGESAAQPPRHIAFIMDGNGRWAAMRGLPRIEGHRRGAEALRRVVRRCREIGVRELTLYALSAENYRRRPAREIERLMGLLRRFLIDERSELIDNDIRLITIGDIDVLGEDILRDLRETVRATAANSSLVMRVAINYGARQEILGAVRAIGEEILAGRIDGDALAAIDENAFRAYLSDPEMTDPDLVIRTAGEFRLSNFLLWQSSYSEWWITRRLWPDFGIPELEEALKAFADRERKYGALGWKTSEGRAEGEGDPQHRPESSTA